MAKTNLESITKRKSELALQIQQYKDVNTQYVKYMQPSQGLRTFWPYAQNKLELPQVRPPQIKREDLLTGVL
jgi:hypothetical protein